MKFANFWKRLGVNHDGPSDQQRMDRPGGANLVALSLAGGCGRGAALGGIATDGESSSRVALCDRLRRAGADARRADGDILDARWTYRSRYDANPSRGGWGHLCWRNGDLG